MDVLSLSTLSLWERPLEKLILSDKINAAVNFSLIFIIVLDKILMLERLSVAMYRMKCCCLVFQYMIVRTYANIHYETEIITQNCLFNKYSAYFSCVCSHVSMSIPTKRILNLMNLS